MVILLGCFLTEILGFLHLAHVSAAILIVSRAVGGDGGNVVDAVAVLMVFPIGVYGCAIWTPFNVLFGQSLTLHVSLDPKVGEEHEEEGSIHPDEVDDQRVLIVTPVHEVILSNVERYQDKLNLLGRNQESAKNFI